ncbi:MAG: hypothetical protein GF364_19825 [Candidatus Lokiarchaeota archaeon]|nr:hypothetical protein [Candidatus Lokiarchaeota archaeon]
MLVKDKIDVFLTKILKGSRKKYLILGLSVLTFLLVFMFNLRSVLLIYGTGTDNPIGIESISFTIEDSYNGEEQKVVGHLYKSRNAMLPALNPTDPAPAEAPAIVALHGFFVGIGKENIMKWTLEIARRDIVVLAIDLPGNGHTVGTVPSFSSHAELEPYIIKEAVDYLKSLPYVNK